MASYLVVPGLNGSGEGHWQIHWLADLANSFLVEQAIWSRPSELDWLATLEEAIVAHPGSIIVAHSLGCVLTAGLANSPVAEHVAGALLVAPCDIGRTEKLHPDRLDFQTMPRERLPFPSIVVASRNDPYMSFAAARSFAGAWGSGLVDLGDAGHINVASGFGRWPEGYALASGLERRDLGQQSQAPKPLDRFEARA
jgi:uncharacterized protein